MSSSVKRLPPIRRRTLSAGERERMREQVQDNERELKGKLEGTEDLSPQARQAFEEQSDGKHLKARTERLKRALAAGSSGPLTGSERLRHEARGKDLGTYLSKMMVPRNATSLRPGNSDFNRAKNMMVRQELGNPVFQEKAREWKNIQRALNPDDPDAANLENIRPATA